MGTGYSLASLDWRKFERFTIKPSKMRLMQFTRLYQEFLEDHYTAWEVPTEQWPKDTDSLSKQVAERLSSLDWYSDYSEMEKDAWEMAIYRYCERPEIFDLKSECNDIVAVDIVHMVFNELGIEDRFGVEGLFGASENANMSTQGRSRDHAVEFVKPAMAGFSTLPFRAKPSSIIFNPTPFQRPTTYYWSPLHSMHPPDNVRELLTELQSIEATVISKLPKGLRTEFTQELLSRIEDVSRRKRLLFVSFTC